MGYSKEELKKIQEIADLEKLKKEFLIFDEKLLNKDYLLIYPDMTFKQLSRLKEVQKQKLNNLKKIEIKFRKEHFTHLVGISKEGKKLSAESFYNRLKENKITKEDYETTIFAEMKSDVFNRLPTVFRQMSIVGNYNYTKPQFCVDKIIGGTKVVSDIVLGLKKINSETYIPCSILKEQTSNLTLKDSERKIIFIFEKQNTELKYSKLIFVHKDFTLDTVTNSQLFQLLSL